jgi:hypothetical protein
MYAIGGEVSISISGGSTPQEQIANARSVIAAAMAPSNPSSQDFAVANSARVMEMKAEQKLTKQKQEQTEGLEQYQATQKDKNTQEIIPFSTSA